jgi:predicted transposase/invertase (TIGR01784 family)
MEDPKNLELVLEIILGREIALSCMPQTEKEVRKLPDKRMARIDVWVKDEEDTVYDVESQGTNTYNLPKRSRYYQGTIDAKLLDPGTTNFNKLNSIFIIMIMPFDLFGEDRYIYTFTMKSDENPEIELKDGATRIFLNTHGKNKDEVSPDLIELLSYIEYTNDLGDDEIQSKYVRDLKRHVDSIKHDREVSVRYMQKWEEMAYEREEGREEGRREGEIVQAKKTVFNLMNMGLSIKEISKAVDTDENTVQEWINTGDLKRVDF